MKYQVTGYRLQVTGKIRRISAFPYTLKPKTLNLRASRARIFLAAGFTLVELLVVVAIMTVVSAIILANYNHFGGEVVVQNTAYDMALSIRQAQVYGISVNGVDGQFNVGYGMYFATVSPNQFLLFADTVVQNGIYDSGEALQTSTLAAGMNIVQLCAPAGTGITVSGSTVTCVGGTPVSKLDILFVRPEPTAWIDASCGLSSSGNETCSGGATSTRIVIDDPKSDYESIIVDKNGEITVQ